MKEKTVHEIEKNVPALVRSGIPETGPELPELPNEHVAISNHHAPRLVERVTALRGQGIGRPPEPKSAVRRRTQIDINGKDPEIPYVKFEAAAHDLVCSLMERQDRMNEEIFYRINDIVYRIEDLEDGRGDGGRR
ncbi:MAG: hypothetical protein LUQ31_01615 [Methanoregula sp.]|nr:hypothetical protein [Methanoregula sp.]